MKEYLCPRPLKPGDRVALLAPSGPLPEGRLARAERAVRDMGLEPVVFDSARQRCGYLAGTDAQRAADLNRAFAGPDIAGVLCARGGYGAQRLHRQIDWETIRCNPKVMCGYSDVTYLHMAIHSLCGFVTYHTPMPSTEWYAGLDEYTEGWLRKALFGGPWGELTNCAGKERVTLRGGKARGRLLGGNLSLVSSAVGTPYGVDCTGAILFLEDIGEQPYRVDRMLNHLLQAGWLEKCSGIVLGYFTDCEAEKPEESLTLKQILDEALSPLGIPVLAGVSCGHEIPTLSLPLGMMAELDADRQTLRIVEG